MSAQSTALYDETEEKFKATSVAVIFLVGHKGKLLV